MKTNPWADAELVNNDQIQRKRFELHIENKIAFIDYILNKKGTIYLTHTEVPLELEGNGVGSALVSKTLDYIREKGLKMAPLCPFVAVYLKDNPQDADGILAPGYSIG